MGVTVYKLGGSLLDWDGWPSRLMELIAASAERPLVVVGGGAAADAVRRWDSQHDLEPSLAHDLAIQAMHLNAVFAARLLPRGHLVDNRDAAKAAWSEDRLPVLDVCAFLAGEKSWHDDPLPRTWETTSDSIAAWVARQWPARLVLLKSVDWDGATSLAQIEAAGLVDGSFPQAADGLDGMSWINLRAEGRLRTLDLS